MCDVNYSVFLLQIAFDIYVFHATEKMVQHGCVFDGVNCIFHSVVEVKFLHVCWTITQILLHIISYTNVVYFICILLLQFSMDGDYRECYAVG